VIGLNKVVMPGLDPDIHHSQKKMDGRVKPGNDGVVRARLRAFPVIRAERSTKRYGSWSKPSLKPFRLIGMPMPSSGVWKMMKVALVPLRI
jgi:hypothetical protein